jgi:hypothetical protein
MLNTKSSSPIKHLYISQGSPEKHSLYLYIYYLSIYLSIYLHHHHHIYYLFKVIGSGLETGKSKIYMAALMSGFGMLPKGLWGVACSWGVLLGGSLVGGL